MSKVFVCALVVIFPMILHGSILMGRSILNPIRSGWNALNTIFNSFPLALSGIAGVLAAGAFLSKPGSAAFYSCIFLSGAFFVVDVYACIVSLLSYISTKK